MKFFLFVASVIGFYFGINYLSFSEGAVDRWVQKTQFPNPEAAELFCSMLTPTTKIQFTYTINNRKPKAVPATKEELCQYYKQRSIPGAKRNTAWITPKLLSHQRSESIPFNQGKASLSINIRTKKYTATRKLDIELKRTFLGDFRIISIQGHDEIKQEEEPRRRH